MATAPALDRGRIAGFCAYDFADSAFATTILAVLFNQYFAGQVAGGPQGVDLFGLRLPGATVWAWLVALSMSIVVALGPFLGALADRRRGRLAALALFWLPGVVATFLLRTVDPGEWVSGGLLFLCAFVCYSAASIFYNSLLPEIAPAERLGRISGLAWGIGYIGGALLLVVNLVMLRRPDLLGSQAGAFDLRDCFASAGIWWFFFALPLFVAFARPRAGAVPLLPRAPTSWWADALASIREVRATGRALLRQRNLRTFFLAYLLYNDGVQTIVSLASVFGAQELGMKPEQLILLFLAIQATAFIGSLGLGQIADRRGHRGMLLVCVVAFTLVSLWAAMVGIFGNALREYWILCSIAGLFLGGIQSGSRSWVTHWIPEGREAEYFGFFSIMTRVAAIFGPLVFGGLLMATGSMRGSILAVALFFVAGGSLLLRVRSDAVASERAALSRA